MMRDLFGECMVLFRPLAIVSGDYYWAAQSGRFKMLAVADCTGHGVPGAFMSMLGMSNLNNIQGSLQGREDLNAAMVLDELRIKIKTALRQNDEENGNHDGMDMGFVVFDTENSLIHFAGAFRPMLFYREGEECVQYAADRMPIGIHIAEKEHFTDNVIEVQKGDTMYIFSDGFTDQFGYAQDGAVKKFTMKRLKAILDECHTLPFAEQKARIERAVDTWKTNATTGEIQEQVDDCLIIGIRI